MRSLRPVITVLAVIAVAACAGDPTAPVAPSTHITRGTDGPTDRKLFFLGRTIDNPTFLGQFDGALDPVVTVTDGAGSVVARFTTEVGTGPARVTVDTARQEYDVTWHARHGTLGDGTYTVTVTVNGLRMGYFDVVRAERMKELRNVDTWNYVPVKDGQPLPIRFRIETGFPIPQGVPGLYLSHDCLTFESCMLHANPWAMYFANDGAVRLTGDGGFGFAWTGYETDFFGNVLYGTVGPVLDASVTDTYSLTRGYMDDPTPYVIWADGMPFAVWAGDASAAWLARFQVNTYPFWPAHFDRTE